jgi:hypothetical protein
MILADIIVTHRQTNGKHDFIYLVFNALNEYDGELGGQLIANAVSTSSQVGVISMRV